MASHDDELVASKTEGFKVGEKKTVEEYAKLGRCSSTLITLSLLCFATVELPSLILSKIRRMMPSTDGKHRSA